MTPNGAPISPAHLFTAVGAPPSGVVPWGTTVPLRTPGVYVIALHADPDDGNGLPAAPINREALRSWARRVPNLAINGTPAKTDELEKHLATWWLPQTSVLYIGKATNLHARVRQFISTPLGAAGPHRGGYWLKTLTVLPRVAVHYVEVDTPVAAGTTEDKMIAEFLNQYLTPPLDHPNPTCCCPGATSPKTDQHPAGAAPTESPQPPEKDDTQGL